MRDKNLKYWTDRIEAILFLIVVITQLIFL